MKTLSKVYYVIALVVGVVMCLVIVREAARSGALEEVLSAWPAFLLVLVAAGLALYYFYRKGGPDSPHQFDFTLLTALVVVTVVVAVVVVIVGLILYALGAFPGI